jgi:hypothetical protein
MRSRTETRSSESECASAGFRNRRERRGPATTNAKRRRSRPKGSCGLRRGSSRLTFHAGLLPKNQRRCRRRLPDDNGPSARVLRLVARQPGPRFRKTDTPAPIVSGPMRVVKLDHLKLGSRRIFTESHCFLYQAAEFIELRRMVFVLRNHSYVHGDAGLNGDEFYFGAPELEQGGRGDRDSSSGSNQRKSGIPVRGDVDLRRKS